MEVDKDYEIGLRLSANFDGYSLWIRGESFSLVLDPEQVSKLLTLIKEIDWDNVEEEE